MIGRKHVSSKIAHRCLFVRKGSCECRWVPGDCRGVEAGKRL